MVHGSHVGTQEQTEQEDRKVHVALLVTYHS